MHRPAGVLLFCLWTLAISGQAPAQTGTPQVPTVPSRDQPVKTPAAAPRTPVVKAAPSSGNAATKPHAASTQRQAPEHDKAGKAHARKPEPAIVPAPPPATAPATAPAPAKPEEKLADPEKPEGAKLPRFASLRSDDVNMRAGPGTRYRIEWVYRRRDLPVEIEREYDVWRWVRDPEGVQGWVHQATLMGRRSFVVQHADAVLRSQPNDTASEVAILKVGVIGRIRSCQAASTWCNVQSGSYRGYLRREQFWGTLPNEAINP